MTKKPVDPFATPAPSMRKGSKAAPVARSTQTINRKKANPFSAGAVNSPKTTRMGYAKVNVK